MFYISLLFLRCLFCVDERQIEREYIWRGREGVEEGEMIIKKKWEEKRIVYNPLD